jgi:hypothetical protein
MTSNQAKELALFATRPRTRLTGYDVEASFVKLAMVLEDPVIFHVLRQKVRLGDRFRVGMRLFKVIGTCIGHDDEQVAQVEEIRPWRSYLR